MSPRFCQFCGTPIDSAGSFCPSCGKSAGQSSGTGGAAVQMARAKEEHIFLQQGNITVTNARFIVGSHTYAMSGVTSVRTAVELPSRKGSVICIGLGILCCLPGTTQSVIAGIVLVAIGVLWWILKKPTFYIVLNSASGEHRSLSSQDRTTIDPVIAALNEAIVSRG